MSRNIYCRRRGKRIQVYSAEYDSTRKRGIQKGLGSLDYIDATSTTTDVDDAIARAANEKLEQALDPVEWQAVKDWVTAEREKVERRRATYHVQFASDRLNELADAFEAARDLEGVNFPDGNAAHEALDRLRKAMKRAGVHRPAKTKKGNEKGQNDPNQTSFLEVDENGDADQG